MIRLEIQSSTAEVLLDRPERLNALSADTFRGLDEALDRILQSDARVIFVRGAGDGAFCAGADIDELAGSPEDIKEWLLRGHSVLRRIETFPRPVVAVVIGLALGGGFELAMACHLLLASTKARFGLPEPKLGLIPGLGGIQRLIAMIGRQRAARLLLTGQTVTAAEADSLGLLSFPPVEPDDLESLVAQVGDAVLALAPSALATILGSAIAAESLGFEEALLHDADLAAKAIQSADGIEGIAAFGEKRPPSFKSHGGTDG